MRHIPALDGLRGVAAFLVLVAHAPFIDIPFFGAALNGFARGSKIGYLGVDLFFVLSGFLITSVILRMKAVPMSSALLIFYSRRALRIFPIYYLTIVVVALAAPQYSYWESALYLSNYSFAVDASPHPLRHTWSLAVEEQFYLLWPLLILSTPQRFLARLIFVTVCLSILSYIALLVMSPHAEALAYRILPTRMLSLSFGAALSLGLPKITIQRVCIVVALTYGLGGGLWAANLPYSVAMQITFSALCFTLVAYILQRPPQWLELAPVKWMGGISYGLYLYHLPVYYFFGISHMQGTARVDSLTVVSAILCTVAIASVSYMLIERPLLRLKETIAFRPKNTRDDMGGALTNAPQKPDALSQGAAIP
jgi:peptidoglycan/LPS O-acetylase OafA/YrhL